MFSIQAKLALVYAAIIMAVLILLNTYPLLTTQNMMFQSKQTALQGQVLLVANTLPVSEGLTAQGVEQAIELLEDLKYDRILVTDEAGLILYDSGEESMLGRYALVGGIVSALQGQDVFHGTYHNGVFRSWAVSPVLGRGRIVGAVYLYERDEEQGVLLKGVQNNLQIISVVVCILVLLTSGLLSRTITKRINALLGAIRIVREGEYTHRIAVSGRDELSQLGEEFNQLTDRLQITEDARRRFVSDASHELKTPLASIRLLTDSILQSDMEQETTREFVEDIGEAADRLIRISEDLLALNRLDAGQKRRVEPVELAAIIQKTCHLLQPLAQAAHVTLHTQLEASTILAHEGELLHIMSNLMENAIKYNLPGGDVFIRTSCQEDRAVITVEDTGLGVPEEDLPHIFDRFYRVDKARAREAGGTGLGLAIVQETVHVHGGQVTARLREGGGLIMTVSFPFFQGGDL